MISVVVVMGCGVAGCVVTGFGVAIGEVVVGVGVVTGAAEVVVGAGVPPEVDADDVVVAAADVVVVTVVVVVVGMFVGLELVGECVITV